MHINLVVYNPVTEKLTPDLKLDIDPTFIAQTHGIPLFYNHAGVEATVRSHANPASATRGQLVDSLFARKTHLATVVDVFMLPSGVMVGTCEVSDRVGKILEKMDISNMKTSLTTRAVHKGRDEPLEISITDTPLRAGCTILSFDSPAKFRARMSATKTPEAWLESVKSKLDPATYAELARLLASQDVGRYAQLVSTLPEDITHDGFNVVASLRGMLEKLNKPVETAPPLVSDPLRSCKELAAKALEHIIGDPDMKNAIMDLMSSVTTPDECVRLVTCAGLRTSDGSGPPAKRQMTSAAAAASSTQDNMETINKGRKSTHEDDLAALFSIRTV